MIPKIWVDFLFSCPPTLQILHLNSLDDDNERDYPPLTTEHYESESGTLLS